HVNRVEGIALGAGATVYPAPHLALNGGVGYGFSDRDWKPHAALTYTANSGAGVSIAAYRVLHDVSVVAERSGLINSFAAQEYGSDYTSVISARGGSLTFSAPIAMALRPTLEIAVERQAMAADH